MNADLWYPTIVAQREMALVANSANLQIDGVWGKTTQKVYEALEPATKTKVDSLLASLGTSAIKIRAARMAQKSALRPTSPAPSVSQAIANASNRTGVPLRMMEAFARIESGFRPDAVNGSSRGLFQIQPSAWADVRAQHPDIPPYNAGVWDPYYNATVAGFYVRQNMRTLGRLGYAGPLDGPALYLAHQQGAGGLTELYNIAERSVWPRRPLVSQEAMLRNPPPDGQAATADKAAFYRRWRSVAEKRMAS